MSIIVIGAGIVGTTIAHELQRRGRQVTLLEREAPGRGTSFGNMASIAVSGFGANSRPEMWRRLPGWLADPEGPMRLRPGAVPRLLPWLARYAAASRPSRIEAIEAAGAALSARTPADLDALLAQIGATDQVSRTGCLSLYAGAAALAADRGSLAQLERYGFPHEVLDRAGLERLEPELGPLITHAVLLPQNRTVRDPYTLVLRVAEAFRARGGRIETGAAVDVARGAEGVREVVLADGRRLPAEAVVIAAGVHSATLARRLGESIPLVTERGYHTQIMAPGIALNHALIWPARAFMVSPTAGGIRVGGTVELAAFEAPPDWRRARITLRRAQDALPRLRAEATSEWMGHRPALPDTIPILSPSARIRGLHYATGHGHMGLTWAATGAVLMADLVTGARPALDPAPFRIDRYRGLV